MAQVSPKTIIEAFEFLWPFFHRHDFSIALLFSAECLRQPYFTLFFTPKMIGQFATQNRILKKNYNDVFV